MACVRAAGPGSFCASSRAGCLEPDSPPGGSGARATRHPADSPSPAASPPRASERCAACRTGAGADPDGCCSGAASPAHGTASREPVSAPPPRTPLECAGAGRAAAQAPAAAPAWPQAADAPLAGQVRCARGTVSGEPLPRGCPRCCLCRLHGSGQAARCFPCPGVDGRVLVPTYTGGVHRRGG